MTGEADDAVRPPFAERAEVAPRPVRFALLIAGALATMVLAALDQNIVNTALPRIVGDLGGTEHISWVVTAFMLTATATTPLYGKLSDRFGRRPLIFLAIGLFLLGSLACGAAQSMPALIGFRALQGLGAGGLLVLGQAMIGDVLPPRERPRWQGLFTGAFALASVAGPVVGGALTEWASWRWVFYVNLPVGGAALAMIWAALPARPPGRPAPLDWRGAAVLTAATAATLLLVSWSGGSTGWASATSLGLLVAVLALWALFLAVERRAADPIVRLALFRAPTFSRGVAVGGMMVFAMMGSTVFLPLYYQLVLDMAPTAAGAMQLPQVAGMVISSVVGGRLVSALGRNRAFLLAGIGLEAVALWSLAVFAWTAAPAAVFLVSMGLLGVGMGLGMPNVTVAVQNAVAHRELGAATGTMNFARSLGGAVGVAASGAVMSAGLAGAFSHIAGIDVADLVAHGVRALASLDPDQRGAVADVYRGALTGSFVLSGVVMSLAFVLVRGISDDPLREGIAIDGEGEGAAITRAPDAVR